MSFRHTEILERARREGKVTVEGLAQEFDVTLQTIRRDLSELAEAGRLVRVHGGAVLPSGISNIGYEERRRLNDEAKTRIGQICAAEIKDGSAVFLGIGTTCEAVARALVHHDALLVMTNNLNAVPILLTNPACRVIVTGGAVRAADSGLVGPQAAASLRQFKFDMAVLGCSALDAEGVLYDFDLDEVIASQAALAQSHAAALVADRSKFERKAPARIAALADVALFCTDAGPLPYKPGPNAAAPRILVAPDA